jgi:hypothetical protein
LANTAPAEECSVLSTRRSHSTKSTGRTLLSYTSRLGFTIRSTVLAISSKAQTRWT